MRPFHPGFASLHPGYAEQFGMLPCCRQTPRTGTRMPRIPIIERAAMNVEQARVYDAAERAKSPVGGPFTAYIRLPKLFEAAQGLRESLASGPLSPREQQIVNMTVARHWGARYPWFAQARRSLSIGIAQG